MRYSVLIAALLAPVFVCEAQKITISEADSLYRCGKYDETVSETIKIQLKALSEADTTTLIKALCLCADACIELGDEDTAIQMYDICSTYTGMIEPMFLLSSSLYNVASIYYESGAYAVADEYITKSIYIDTQRNGDSVHALRFLLAAKISYAQGDYEKALSLVAQGKECSEINHNKNVEGRLMLLEANCYEALAGDSPDWHTLEKSYSEAYDTQLSAYQTLPHRSSNPYLAESCYDLGRVKVVLGKLDEAEQYFKDAVDYSGETTSMRGKSPIITLQTFNELASLMQMKGRPDLAAEYSARANALSFVPYVMEMSTKLSLSQMEFIRRQKDVQIEHQTVRARAFLIGAIFMMVMFVILLLLFLRQVRMRRTIEQKNAQLLKLSFQKDKLINIIKSDESSTVEIPEDISRDTDMPEVKLSKREKDVLILCSKGLMNKEIASALNISVRTVETHKLNICHKVGVSTTAELVAFAYRYGWITKTDS